LGQIRFKKLSRKRRKDMVSNSNVIPIIEFDGSDYEYGSIWMKTLLKARGYWDIIDVGYNDFVD